jgi:hypothetical protein
MSVVALVKYSVADVSQALEALRAEAALGEEITADARAAGALHHRVYVGDGEIVEINEWPTVQQLHGFVAGNSKLQELAVAVGSQGPPEVSVITLVDVPGSF